MCSMGWNRLYMVHFFDAWTRRKGTRAVPVAGLTRVPAWQLEPICPMAAKRFSTICRSMPRVMNTMRVVLSSLGQPRELDRRMEQVLNALDHERPLPPFDIHQPFHAQQIGTAQRRSALPATAKKPPM